MNRKSSTTCTSPPLCGATFWVYILSRRLCHGGGHQRSDRTGQQRHRERAHGARSVGVAALLRQRLGELLAQRCAEVGQGQGLGGTVVLLYLEAEVVYLWSVW